MPDRFPSDFTAQAEQSDRTSVAFSISLIIHALLLSLPAPGLRDQPVVLHPSPPARVPLEVRLPDSSIPPRLEVTARVLPEAPAMPLPVPASTNEATPPAKDQAPPPPDMPYLLSTHLDRPVELIGGLRNTLPFMMSYPRTGQLLLRLIVDETGVPRHVQTLQSDLPPVLEGSLVLAFFRASYRPGLRDGQPVAAEMLIKIDFGDTPEHSRMLSPSTSP